MYIFHEIFCIILHIKSIIIIITHPFDTWHVHLVHFVHFTAYIFVYMFVVKFVCFVLFCEFFNFFMPWIFMKILFILMRFMFFVKYFTSLHKINLLFSIFCSWFLIIFFIWYFNMIFLTFSNFLKQILFFSIFRYISCKFLCVYFYFLFLCHQFIVYFVWRRLIIFATNKYECHSNEKVSIQNDKFVIIVLPF